MPLATHLRVTLLTPSSSPTSVHPVHGLRRQGPERRKGVDPMGPNMRWRQSTTWCPMSQCACPACLPSLTNTSDALLHTSQLPYTPQPTHPRSSSDPAHTLDQATFSVPRNSLQPGTGNFFIAPSSSSHSMHAHSCAPTPVSVRVKHEPLDLFSPHNPLVSKSAHQCVFIFGF